VRAAHRRKCPADRGAAARSPPLEKQFDGAKASAAASLSHRPHSRAELKGKLRDKGFDGAAAKRALDRLEELVRKLYDSRVAAATGLPGAGRRSRALSAAPPGAGHAERRAVRRDLCALQVAAGALGALAHPDGARPPPPRRTARKAGDALSAQRCQALGAQELSRRGLAKPDIEVGLHAVFGSDPNSVQLCPPGAEECALDDAAHEPDRAPPPARRRPVAEGPCACVAGSDCTICLAQHAGRAQDTIEQGATSPRAGLDQQLLGSVRRQAHLSRGLPPETRRRRLVAWLQRRGHTWGTVSALLRELHLDG